MSSLSAAPSSASEPPSAARAGAPAELDVASLQRRALAHLIDGFLSLLAFMGAFLVIGLVTALILSAVNDGEGFVIGGTVDEDSSASELLGVAVVGALMWALPLAYLALAPGRQGAKNGFTLGKRVAGVRIVSADGSPLAPATARRRAFVFLGPVAAASVAGPLLDAAMGTPPLLTMLMLFVALLYSAADLAFAPVRGRRRASIHDRMAGTTVVRWPSGLTALPEGPTLIADRPVTGMTGLVPVAAAGALLLCFLAALVAGVGAGDVTTEPEAPRPVAAARSGASTLDPAARPAAQAAKEAKAAAGAQVEAGVLARGVATCLGKIEDLAFCQTVFADGVKPELAGVEGPAPGRSSIGRSGAFLSNGRTVLSVVVYDRKGLGWGYRMRAGGLIEPMCTSIAGVACADSPAAARFLAGGKAYDGIRRAYTAARDAPPGNVTPDTP